MKAPIFIVYLPYGGIKYWSHTYPKLIGNQRLYIYNGVLDENKRYAVILTAHGFPCGCREVPEEWKIVEEIIPINLWDIVK